MSDQSKHYHFLPAGPPRQIQPREYFMDRDLEIRQWRAYSHATDLLYLPMVAVARKKPEKGTRDAQVR